MSLVDPQLAAKEAPMSERDLMRREQEIAAAAVEAARRSNPNVPQMPPEFAGQAAAQAGPRSQPSAALRGDTAEPAQEADEYPAVVSARLTWTNSSGVPCVEVLPIRVLSRDEQIEVSLRCTRAVSGSPAARTGVVFDDLPVEDQLVIRGIATAEVMWPGMSSQLREAVHNREDLAVEVLEASRLHRALRFRQIDREGQQAAPRASVQLVAGASASTKTK